MEPLDPFLKCSVLLLPTSSESESSQIPRSSCTAAVLQSGACRLGDGEGAGVGGEAGAEGRLLPGITLGFVGILIGMLGPVGVCIGRGFDCRRVYNREEEGFTCCTFMVPSKS